jgi:hypothetical protein
VQGEAIAYNLREMFGLRVPIISVVIGEGGSGGALAIGCANRNLIMENAVYYVASPEACAAILWKSRADAGKVCASVLQPSVNHLFPLQPLFNILLILYPFVSPYTRCLCILPPTIHVVPSLRTAARCWKRHPASSVSTFPGPYKVVPQGQRQRADN